MAQPFARSEAVSRSSEYDEYKTFPSENMSHSSRTVAPVLFGRRVWRHTFVRSSLLKPRVHAR
jgi:hypothetical protein